MAAEGRAAVGPLVPAPVRYPSYRLLRMPTIKQGEPADEGYFSPQGEDLRLTRQLPSITETMKKQILPDDMPVWFYVAPSATTEGEVEGRGPFSLNEFRKKFADGVVKGSTL